MKKEDIAQIFEGATEEQIKAVLDINSNDIGQAKQKLEIERDNYKSQLDTAQTALKEFEGVDVKELNVKIAQLTADLETKDTEYKAKIADIEFNSMIDTALTSSGARNLKAVKALLDIDTLKASKNQAEDIKNAIAAVKTENDYMFGEVHKPFVPVNPAGGGVDGEKKMSLEDKMRYVNAHPNVDINTLF